MNTKAITKWLLGLALAATFTFVMGPSTADADHRPVPYAEWVTASAYGPCCYEGNVGAGLVSFDGRIWEGMQPWHASIASPTLRRGTGVCLFIPHGRYGIVRCDRPVNEENTMRSRLTISDHLPAKWNRGLDLSVGFLRDIDFCEIEQTDLECARKWGVRYVKLFVFG